MKLDGDGLAEEVLKADGVSGFESSRLLKKGEVCRESDLSWMARRERRGYLN